MGEADKYDKAESDRRAYVDAVVNSNAEKRIVVAGPGTGKTFLFKEILKGGKVNALTLTFVNSLVEDLSLELRGLSEVRTLHGFARSVLSQAVGSIQVFPLLSRVIRDDLETHSGKDVDFDSIFNDRDDENGDISFYKLRKDYYRHNGHTDLIYAAARYLELKSKRIPKFDLVLVDEFQDFNKLEVSLIDLLAKKSKILIAGDDDQALYFFKDANPVHIRKRYTRALDDYIPFTLIHCSRCTRVIVEAFNDVIRSALAGAYLKGRVDKKFLYFEDRRKEEDSKKYSKLTRILVHSGQIPYAIERELDTIATEVRDRFSTLVIAPTKNQCRAISKGLRAKGFRNVSFVDRDEKAEPSLLDGVMLLLKDKDCNLGWRILAKLLLSNAEFAELLKKSIDDPEQKFHALVDAGFRKRIKKLLKSSRTIAKGKTISESDCIEVFQDLGEIPLDLSKKWLRERLEALPVGVGLSGLRDLPIRISTIPGSKGLSEDYVFITHFDDRFFLDDGEPTDQNICNFLVALTRARKKAFLISCQTEEPKFLSWMLKERVETVSLRGE